MKMILIFKKEGFAVAYATRQHQAILQCLQQADRALTAAELAEDLRKSGCSVGLATIYRQLEKLEAAGRIHRVHTQEGSFYQYCPHAPAEHPCFLLRCEVCGRIVHLDCTHLEQLCRHLESEHHFLIDPRQTVLTGRCQSCAERKEPCGTQ